MVLMPGMRTSDVKITLVINGGQKISTRPKPDGSFALLDVPPGMHLLDTFALGYTFPPLRLGISAADGTISAEYAEDSAEKLSTSPLVLRPISTAEYYEPRAKMSLGSLMKNPMFLLVSATVFLAWLTPKMMENMDPEALKEMQEQMQNQPSMQDILSGKAFKDAEEQEKKARKGVTGKEARAEKRSQAGQVE